MVGGEHGRSRSRCRARSVGCHEREVRERGKPRITQERIDALLRELAEDVLASEGLESFLTVTTLEGGTPTVITVSRLSRFRSGMRQTSPYDGHQKDVFVNYG